MGTARPSARWGAEKACSGAIHSVATRHAGPGSSALMPEHGLTKVRVRSSQTFRHAALLASDSS